MYAGSYNKQIEMKKTCFALFFYLLAPHVFSQTAENSHDFNLDFEKSIAGQKLPANWIQWGAGYVLSVDPVERKSGKYAVAIKSHANKN